MRHVISAIVENKPGVLAHIAGLFSSRGFNIDSLAVGVTEDRRMSRMTIVVKGDDAILEQVRKQLGKVIDVIKVSDFSEEDYVDRELMLVKVNAAAGRRGEIIEIVDIFRGKIIDVGQRELIIEIAGQERKLDAALDLLRPFGIKETCRTGVVAVVRGAKR